MIEQQGMKISIITACYNSEQTIEQTIQSVLKQTYKNIEYIIIDGTSTDRTMAIIEKYREWIDVVVTEEDSGVYDAFNKGLQYVTGEYIMFLNSDDYFVGNDVIKHIETFIKQNKSPIAIYGNIYYLNERTGQVTKQGKNLLIDDIQNGEIPQHPSFVFNKKVLEYIKQFDSSYQISADYEFMLKVILKYGEKVLYSNITTTYFRLGGLSSNLRTKELRDRETNTIRSAHNITPIRSKLNNANYWFKKWIENIYFKKGHISYSLTQEGITSVAIFGSGDFALFVAKDLLNEGIKVVNYYDNSIDKQGLFLNGVIVKSPNQMAQDQADFDAVILAFEENHEEEVKTQISELFHNKEDSMIRIICWKELLELL